MKRTIIKSVTSVGNHAWFFKDFLKANSVFKEVLKGSIKNFSLDKNSEVINVRSGKQNYYAFLSETKNVIWLKSFLGFLEA